MSLLDTHPHLGVAAIGARWQRDLTGDYPAQQFCEILRHDHDKARCHRCGGTEHRHTIIDRLLVSGNKGLVRTHWRQDCGGCGYGTLSNYRRPWVR